MEKLESRLLLSSDLPQVDPLLKVDGHLREWIASVHSGENFGPQVPAGEIVAANSPVQIDQQGRPLVRVRAAADFDRLLDVLAAHGAKMTATSAQYGVADVRLDWPGIQRLAALPEVLSLTTAYAAVHRAGAVAGQGDGALDSDATRALGFDGSSFLIGVLSNSAEQLSDSQATGDLPIGVDRYFELGGINDEGRAMLEIIHDIAPGAGLAHHSALESDLSFAEGIFELAQAGSRIDRRVRDRVGHGVGTRRRGQQHCRGRGAVLCSNNDRTVQFGRRCRHSFRHQRPAID